MVKLRFNVFENSIHVDREKNTASVHMLFYLTKNVQI